MTQPSARAIGRAVAIAVAAAAPVVMASAQAMVIRDRVAIVHPLWPAWSVAAMAVGFELAILTTGLAIVVTGHRDRWLLAGELFLIGMSVAVAVTSALALAPWVLSLTIALVPLQYVVAFYAAHALYVHWYGSPVAEPAPALVAAPQMAPAPKPRRTPAKLAPAAVPADGNGKLATDARVAELAGVKPRTARQWRTVGDARYGQALAAGGNGHAEPA